MMLKKYKIALLAAAFLGMNAATASATYMADITYNGTHSGNAYTLTFDVNNTSDGGSTAALDYFMITLDAGTPSNYTSIAWAANNGWASAAAQYDPAFGGVPGYVLADDSILGSNGGGIAQGGHQGGFQITFNYPYVAGASEINQMIFSWQAQFGTYLSTSPSGYDVLGNAAGLTRYVDNNKPVPEPATMLLMGTGLAGLIGAARRKKVE